MFWWVLRCRVNHDVIVYMEKSEAIKLLGGSVSATAAAVGVTYQAVHNWPPVLPQRIADRVQAALWRQAQEQAQAGLQTLARGESASADV
jgi:hypothetical protein